jgi:hypothetical protein
MTAALLCIVLIAAEGDRGGPRGNSDRHESVRARLPISTHQARVTMTLVGHDRYLSVFPYYDDR